MGYVCMTAPQRHAMVIAAQSVHIRLTNFVLRPRMVCQRMVAGMGLSMSSRRLSVVVGCSENANSMSMSDATVVVMMSSESKTAAAREWRDLLNVGMLTDMAMMSRMMLAMRGVIMVVLSAWFSLCGSLCVVVSVSFESCTAFMSSMGRKSCCSGVSVLSALIPRMRLIPNCSHG